MIHMLQKEIDVWVFTERYAPVIEVDCSNLSPNMPIKIGDIEKLLPDGMFLHQKWQKRRFHSFVKLTDTNIYIQRKNEVIEQAEMIREEKQKIQSRLLNNEDGKEKRSTGMNVPLYIRSSKHIINEKKIAQKDFGDGVKRKAK